MLRFLGKKYTDEEAMDVFNTGHSFMQHLATKLHELCKWRRK